MRAVKHTLHSPFFLPKCAYIPTPANSNGNQLCILVTTKPPTISAINDNYCKGAPLTLNSKQCVTEIAYTP